MGFLSPAPESAPARSASPAANPQTPCQTPAAPPTPAHPSATTRSAPDALPHPATSPASSECLAHHRSPICRAASRDYFSNRVYTNGDLIGRRHRWFPTTRRFVCPIHTEKGLLRKSYSGRQDLNLRPLGPE